MDARTTNPAPNSFIATFTSDGGTRIELQRQIPARMFGRPRTEIIPTERWTEASDGGRALLMLDMVASGEAEDAGDAIHLSPGLTAALSEVDALALGLPVAAPLVLSVRGRGLIVDPDFRVETRWTRTSGRDIAATITGARASLSGEDFRLPEPLFGLFAAAAAINSAPDLPSRQSAFADMRRMLEGNEAPISLDDTLREMRVAFAGNFSLALEGDRFAPVLFAPRIGAAASEGDAVDETADNLLTPSQQVGFANAFRAAAGRRRSYLLPDGLLLFLDPTLSRALEVVGQKQRAPASERRRFAAAPRRFIAEALGEDAAPIETLFIETQQYSERVTGIDPWKKPVLPWIKPRPNSWLPERFGLTIGDPPDQQNIEISPEELAATVATVAAAIAEGAECVRIGDTDVPATPATMKALDDLNTLFAAVEGSSPLDTEGEPPPTISDRFFLQVRDNLESVAYAPLARPQAAPAEPAVVSNLVKTQLKPHQIEGFRWLVDCWRSHRPGALLADDMGLGKTLQALAFFCWLREQGVTEPLLIVAPTGLLANWQAEMARHLVPDALGKVFYAYGSGLSQSRIGSGSDIAAGKSQLDASLWRDAGVVLTTYETLRDYHISMAQTGFAVVAFDEAQRIKNPAAQITRAAKTLRARFEIALTGTPVENRLHDLWSIADVIHPGLLGASKAFETEFATPEIDALRTLNTRLTTGAAPWPAFMLRRMKADHVEGLPPKTLREQVVTMPVAQANAYSAAINRALALRGSGRKGAMLETLARLRSVSLAPELPHPGPDFALNSARLQATFAVLDQVRDSAEKALIFCESLALQPLLATEIRRRYVLSYPVSCISGEVPGDIRQRLVDRFQERDAGFDVMILSPRAGGVGLTITAANHVIHLTRWWNPAVEDQATDRVYRIGQTKDVTVWVPIAEHPDPAIASFDRRLADLLQRKRSLAQGLLVEPESEGDAQALFDDVLGGVIADAIGDIEAVDDIPRLAPEPVETIPPATPVALTSAPPPQPPKTIGHARFEKQANQPPPIHLFTEALLAAGPVRLDIEDPYVAGSVTSCRALGEFLASLRSAGVVIDRVAVTCWDNDSLEYNLGSDAAQQRVLADALHHFRVADIRLLPEFVSRRRRQLHDRSVTARLADGSRIIWDLGRGIEGLMTTRQRCTVTRTVNPPSNLPT